MHHLTRRLGRLLMTATAVAIIAAAPAPVAQAAAPSHRATAPVGGGQLVLVGGSLSDSNTEIYGEIVRRAGGAKARIGVITAASVPKSQDPDVGTKWESNSEFNGAFYSDLLEKYGAGDAEYIPVDLDHVAAADDPALAEKVRSMTGFFFGGGDQYRLVQVLQRGPKQRDSKVLAAIREAFDGGAVVAGTSAGAQIQAGADMVTGGESWEGLVDGAEPGYFDDATKLGYLPEGGFGFFRSGLLDTHFTAYGREGRAVRLAADTGNRRVFGLDPNTALVVDHAGTASEQLSVIGQRGVSVIDLGSARTSTDAAGRWAIDGVQWTWLTRGDRYDPRRERTTAAGDTAYLSPVDRALTVETSDVFSSLRGTSSGYELIGLARDLVATTRASASGTTLEKDPQFTVTLTQTADTRARTRDGSTAAAFTGLVLGIHAS